MEDFQTLLNHIKKHSNTISTKRTYILKEIFFASKPLNAKEIQKSIGNNHNIKISLPALYTSLQYFEELHVINSIFIASIKTKYYYLKGVKSQNFLICLNCGKITSFKDVEINKKVETISQNNSFILLTHKAILYGYCKECDR